MILWYQIKWKIWSLDVPWSHEQWVKALPAEEEIPWGRCHGERKRFIVGPTNTVTTAFRCLSDVRADLISQPSQLTLKTSPTLTFWWRTLWGCHFDVPKWRLWTKEACIGLRGPISTLKTNLNRPPAESQALSYGDNIQDIPSCLS